MIVIRDVIWNVYSPAHKQSAGAKGDMRTGDAQVNSAAGDVHEVAYYVKPVLGVVHCGNGLGDGLLGVIHGVRGKIHKCFAVQHVGLDADESGRLSGEDAGLIEERRGSIGCGLHDRSTAEYCAKLTGSAKADKRGDRHGGNDRHGRADDDYHKRAVNGYGVCEVCEKREDDSVQHRESYREFQNRTRAVLHHALYWQLKSFVLLYEGGNLFRGLAVLIVQQIERGFFGLVLRIGQKNKPYLIENYQRGALGGKADDK